MTCLLDVSLLVALGWSSHTEHARAVAFVDEAPEFCTCTATFGSSFAEALRALQSIVAIPAHRFITDETAASDLPVVASWQDVTDAHLVSE